MAPGTPTGLGATGFNTGLSAYGQAMSGAAPSGSRLFVALGWWASSARTVSSITGTTGLAWSQVATSPGVGDTHGMEVWTADAPAGHSAVTVTANFSGALAGCNIHVWYQTGLASSTPIDGTPAKLYRLGGVATSALAVGPVTTTAADSTVYAFAFSDGGAVNGLSLTQTSPWAEVMADVHTVSHDWGSALNWRAAATATGYSVAETWVDVATPTAPQFGDNVIEFAIKAAAGTTVNATSGLSGGGGPSETIQKQESSASSMGGGGGPAETALKTISVTSILQGGGGPASVANKEARATSAATGGGQPVAAGLRLGVGHDELDRADGNPGANWTANPMSQGEPGMLLAGGALTPDTSSAASRSWWNADQLGGARSVSFRLTARPASNVDGVTFSTLGLVQLPHSLGIDGPNGYDARVLYGASADSVEIWRWDDSFATRLLGPTALGSRVPVGARVDLAYSTGGVLTASVAGTVVGSVTDATYLDGIAFAFLGGGDAFGTPSSTRMDYFSFSNLGLQAFTASGLAGGGGALEAAQKATGSASSLTGGGQPASVPAKQESSASSLTGGGGIQTTGGQASSANAASSLTGGGDDATVARKEVSTGSSMTTTGTGSLPPIGGASGLSGGGSPSTQYELQPLVPATSTLSGGGAPAETVARAATVSSGLSGGGAVPTDGRKEATSFSVESQALPPFLGADVPGSALYGGGGLASAFVHTPGGGSSLTGGGQVAASESRSTDVASGLTGGGDVIAQGVSGGSIQTSLSTGGDIVSAVSRTATALSAPTGGGDLAETVRKDASSASASTGGGQPSETAQKAASAPSGLSGGGQGASSAEKDASSASALSGGGSPTTVGGPAGAFQSSLSTGGEVPTVASKSVSVTSGLGGGGSPTATARKEASGASTLDEGGTSSSASNKQATLASALTGGGATTSTGGAAGTIQSTLSGGGFIQTVYARTALAASSLTDDGAPTAGAAKARPSPSALAGGGDASATGAHVAVVASGLVGGGATQTVAVRAQVDATSSLSGGGRISHVVERIAYGDSTLSGGGSMSSLQARPHLWGPVPSGGARAKVGGLTGRAV